MLVLENKAEQTKIMYVNNMKVSFISRPQSTVCNFMGCQLPKLEKEPNSATVGVTGRRLRVPGCQFAELLKLEVKLAAVAVFQFKETETGSYKLNWQVASCCLLGVRESE